MPKVPNRVTIDRKQRKVFVDGVEFPWMIAEQGPDVDDIANPHAIPTVTIPIIAADVEVIPAGDRVITYGDRGGRTSEEVMDYLDKR
ncbi:hypothetical protein SEA_MALACHAI_10 [Gordonia phage Malachai]|nr:hypothetical protein SEA_BEGONIA_10 [Gordonia phage Begonia]UVF60441.1 hypothetical protein SEA_MALACHAI_10 [Gordonia phage Malachai]